MGCWNETCFLSNLPILYSDKVKVFILMKNDDTDSRLCYTTNNYIPICLPFDAEYDEYGGIEYSSIGNNISGRHTEHLLKNLEFVNDDGSEYYYVDVERLVDDILENNVKISIYGSVKNLTVVYMHRDLYDRITDNCKSIVPIGNDGKTLYDCLSEKYTNIENDLLDLYEMESDKDRFVETDVKRMNIERKIYGLNCVPRLYFPFRYLLSKDHIPAEMLNYFMNQFVDFITFDMSLGSARKGYLSISGTGSQRNDVRVQKIIAEFTLELIKDRCENNNDNDDDCGTPYDDNIECYWFDD